nr:hypothetical transcript [Hymenolepis microstoma]
MDFALGFGFIIILTFDNAFNPCVLICLPVFTLALVTWIMSCYLNLHLSRLLLGFVILSPSIFLSEASVYNVTIPSKEISVRDVSAYLLTFGEVKKDVERASFAFDLLKVENLAILYTFKHFNLPKLSFNSRSECAALDCSLSNTQGDTISQIAASCHDNSSPQLYGPIVTVPGASKVTCKVVWYYPVDKSALPDSLKLLFVGVCKFLNSIYV